MLWLFTGLFTAFSESLKGLFVKKALNSSINEITIIFYSSFIMFLFFGAISLFSGIPEIGPNFFKALIISGTLNAAAAIFYYKALKFSDLSLVMPLQNFSPLLLLVTSFVILGEFPNHYGVFGVLLIVLGSYFLNVGCLRQDGWFGPIRGLFRNKGSQCMLLVVLFWSVSANFDKMGALNSSPIFWLMSVGGWIVVILLPAMIMKFRTGFHLSKNELLAILPICLFAVLSNLFHVITLTLTFVVFAISIKRLSTLFSVVWGKVFLKEKDAKSRLAGAAVMFLGVLLIALFGGR